MFANPSTGRPLDRTKVTRRFKAACSEAGVPVVPFHELRNTCATRLAASGQPLRTLQEFLGHGDIIDKDLGLRPVVVLVADAVGVRELRDSARRVNRAAEAQRCLEPEISAAEAQVRQAQAQWPVMDALEEMRRAAHARLTGSS